MHIGICEDDAAILEIISLTLEDAGYEVYPATSRNKLMDITAQQKLDLLVLDYWIGDIKADQILQDLANTKLNNNLPVLLISAIHDLNTLGKSLPVSGVLQKPFELDTLQAKVKQILTEDEKNHNN